MAQRTTAPPSTIVDDVCFIKSMYTEAINHDPAITMFQTGSQIAGRPSLGSWLMYGLGSENENLPGFIVLASAGQGDQPLYARLWGSGFLDSRYQGIRLRAGKDAVLYLSNPDGVCQSRRRAQLDTINAINRHQFEKELDPEIESRIAQYEMAFRIRRASPKRPIYRMNPSQPSSSTVKMLANQERLPPIACSPAVSPNATSDSSNSIIRDGTQHASLPKQITNQCMEPIKHQRPWYGISNNEVCSTIH